MASSLFPKHAKTSTPQSPLVQRFEQFQRTLNGDPKALFDSAMQSNPGFRAFVENFQRGNPNFRR